MMKTTLFEKKILRLLNSYPLFSTFIFVSVFIIVIHSCGDSKINKELISSDSTITFSEHIAPIIYKNCSPCHRPGESGPMSLMNYQQVKSVANKIKFVTQTKFMPPWPADPNYSHFIGERTLSELEILKIKLWVEQGAKEGDPKKCPSPPVFFTGSFFGKPDLQLRMQDAIKLEGNGRDNFLMIKIPYEISKDTFVKHFEFVPHQRKLVHHVNGHLICYDNNRPTNHFTGANILPDALDNFNEHFSKMNLAYADNKQPNFPPLFTNAVYFLPGYTPPVYPEGVGGFSLSKKGVILLKNVHYGPSAKTVFDSSYINVFFAKEKPKRPLRELQIGTFGISPVEPELVIPPETIKTFHSSWKVPETISLLSVNPHMHLLGKTFLAYAITPKGDTIRLIKINRWDFRWQYYYTFKKMLKIPAGSEIHAFGTFDNTSKNPFNPFHPPKTVSQGEGLESMQTTEEMFQFIFTYLPYLPGDENNSLE